MKNKITNRTQVYRAVYYSGFTWTRTRTSTSDSYKLVDKTTSHSIYIEHIRDDELKMDFIEAKTTDSLTPEELARFTRLCYKIKRRTKDLGIKQDLFELAESTENLQGGKDA